MLRKLAAAAALSAAVVVAPAGVASAEPYPPKIPTETHIAVVRAEPGKPVLLDVSASANNPTPPEGDIDVAISAASSTARSARAVAAAPLFTTTVHFDGDVIRVTGPTLPRGRYVATAALTPDDQDFFLPSDTATTFRIAVGGDTGGEDDDDDNLPNTGGPDMMWLLLGGALVAAGAGGVAYGRRRAQGVPA